MHTDIQTPWHVLIDMPLSIPNYSQHHLDHLHNPPPSPYSRASSAKSKYTQQSIISTAAPTVTPIPTPRITHDRYDSVAISSFIFAMAIAGFKPFGHVREH